MTTRGFALPAVAVVLLVSRAASAQAQYTTPDSPAWLADRRYNEGIGVRTGNFELHPGIAGEFGYDSNYLLRSTMEGVTNGEKLRIEIFRQITLGVEAPIGIPKLQQRMVENCVQAAAQHGENTQLIVRPLDGA